MTPRSHTDNAAARLALWRIRDGRSTKDAAPLLDVCPATFNRIERGDLVRFDKVLAIAELLGLTLEQVTAPLTREEMDAAVNQPSWLGRAAHNRLTFFGMLEAV